MAKNFYRKVLKNGLTIIFEKRDIPVVSVAFAVRSGGINEVAEEKGISHYIEHLLYKGTKNRSVKQIAEEIEKNGGDLNGFTGEEITAFWCKMPSKHLNVALSVLGDMVKNPLFDKEEMEKERKVIFEEIKMRRDSPRVYVCDEIMNLMYKEPCGTNLIGTAKTMKSIDRKKILEKFEKVYQPNNMILCVVGDAELKEIVDFAEKNFGKEKGVVREIDVKLRNGEKTEKRKGIDQASLVFAYHVGLAGSKESYVAFVLNTLMAGGMSSRLFSEIREKRNLAYAVKGELEINKRFGYNFVYVGTSKEYVGEVKKLIVEEFDKVAADLGEEELKQVKEQLIGNYQISLEDSQVQMLNLLGAEIAGNAEMFYEFEKRVAEVKLKDVKELAKKAKQKHSFFVLVPE